MLIKHCMLFVFYLSSYHLNIVARSFEVCVQVLTIFNIDTIGLLSLIPLRKVKGMPLSSSFIWD